MDSNMNNSSQQQHNVTNAAPPPSSSASERQIYSSSQASSTRPFISASPSSPMLRLGRQSLRAHPSRSSSRRANSQVRPPEDLPGPILGLNRRSYQQGSPLASPVSCSGSPQAHESVYLAPGPSTSGLGLHRADSESTMTNFSGHSAPPVGGMLRNGSGSFTGSASNSIIGTKALRRQPQVQQQQARSRSQDFERGYLKISAPMVDELIKYRRVIVVIALAFLYAIFAFGATVLRPRHEPSQTGAKRAADDWTQEMIAGWHMDRPLTLSLPTNISINNGKHGAHSSRHRIRECRTRAQIHQQHQHEQVRRLLQLQASGAATTTTTSTSTTGRPTASNVEPISSRSPAPLKASTSTNKTISTSTTTTEKPATVEPSQIRRRRKFEALNGCLFRRDITSESMGDLCCCAGAPRYVMITNDTLPKVNATTTVAPAPVSSNTTQSAASTRKPSGDKTATSTNKPANASQRVRKYLRPQLLCFVSTAAHLFNAQNLVAPLANEYNLKHAFIQDKGKCITCSCCHEHEPEKVNKMLAGVPLYADKPPRPKAGSLKGAARQIDAGDSLDRDEPEESSAGFWVRIRNALVNWMQRLDKFFFWLYDLFDQTIMVARYGSYPVTSFSDAPGFVLVQSAALMRPESFDHKHATGEAGGKNGPGDAPNLYIDEDTYDDFIVTTTSTTTTAKPTTTTTTTKPPTTRRRVLGTTTTSSSTTTRKPKKKKKKSRPKTATTSTGRPLQTSVAPNQRSSSTSAQPTRAINATAAADSSGNTTKSPTVIINVYAAGSEPAKTSTTTTTSTAPPTTTTTTATRQPTVLLLAGGNTEKAAEQNKQASGANHSAPASLATGGDQKFELRIKLDTTNVNQTTTTMTHSFNSTSQSGVYSHTPPSNFTSKVNPILHAEQPAQNLPATNGSLLSQSNQASANLSSSSVDATPLAPNPVSLNSTFAQQSQTPLALATPRKPLVENQAPLNQSSIVISLGQGDSPPQIIATINTTRSGLHLTPSGSLVQPPLTTQVPTVTMPPPTSNLPQDGRANKQRALAGELAANATSDKTAALAATNLTASAAGPQLHLKTSAVLPAATVNGDDDDEFQRRKQQQLIVPVSVSSNIRR